MPFLIQASTKREPKNPIDQILHNVNEHPTWKRLPNWRAIRPIDIENKLAFQSYRKPMVLVPPYTFAPAKEIRVDYERMSLAELTYVTNAKRVVYSAQQDLRECLWQINALFGTCFHPAEENVEVTIQDANTLLLRITDNNHLLFVQSSIAIPAVDVSLNLQEMVETTAVYLTREESYFAVSMYGKLTEKRRYESKTYNAYDALFLAIALRSYELAPKWDGLAEYEIDVLPPCHMLTLSNGIVYGKNNRVAYTPTEEDAKDYNTITKISYVPNMPGYIARNDNEIDVQYTRMDIKEYVKIHFNLAKELDVLTIRVPGVNDYSEAPELMKALRDHLSFHPIWNVQDREGHVYDQEITLTRRDGDIVFNFNRHPLLKGEIRVDFGDA